MKSTNFNLNASMTQKEINAFSIIENNPALEVAIVTQDEYDVMQYHDEHTVYVIKDDEPRMYMGSKKIPVNKNDTQYLVGYDPSSLTYILYVNQVAGYKDNIIPIAEFKTAQEALRALSAYSTIGTHARSDIKILTVLDDYLQQITGMNTTIISMISSMGYRDDARLQYLNELSIIFGDDLMGTDISPLHRESLYAISQQHPESLAPLYSEIYDVFVKYNFFNKYEHVDDLGKDLIKNVLSDINSAYSKYQRGLK